MREMEAEQERAEQPQPRGNKLRLAVSSLLPIIALGLSLISFYVSWQTSRDVSRLDVIKTEYGLFHDLAQLQLQNPLMTHLFTVTNQSYEATVAQIKASSAAISPPEHAKLLLQERAFAHYLFTTYEET